MDFYFVSTYIHALTVQLQNNFSEKNHLHFLASQLIKRHAKETQFKNKIKLSALVVRMKRFLNVL